MVEAPAAHAGPRTTGGGNLCMPILFNPGTMRSSLQCSDCSTHRVAVKDQGSGGCIRRKWVPLRKVMLMGIVWRLRRQTVPITLLRAGGCQLLSYAPGSGGLAPVAAGLPQIGGGQGRFPARLDPYAVLPTAWKGSARPIDPGKPYTHPANIASTLRESAFWDLCGPLESACKVRQANDLLSCSQRAARKEIIAMGLRGPWRITCIAIIVRRGWHCC